MAPKRKLLEVCIDNFASAIAAEAGGAGRIELCSSLREGGLTPSVGFLKMVKSNLQIPIFVMIRPRGGDFVYSSEEIQIMEEDITILKENGADGFVFGILDEDGKVDVPNCSKLRLLTAPLPSTFHRAFDLTPDPEEAMEQIISLGFDRILTSGQQRTAEEGISIIKSLVRKANGRICIMAGAGVTPSNASIILDQGEVVEIHGSCRVVLPSSMLSTKVSMGSMPDEIHVTDQSSVEAICHQLR